MQSILTVVGYMILGGFIVDLITTWINYKEKLEMENEYKFRTIALNFVMHELLYENLNLNKKRNKKWYEQSLDGVENIGKKKRNKK